MPDCGVHCLWFAFVCFLIRSHPPPPSIRSKTPALTRPKKHSHTPTPAPPHLQPQVTTPQPLSHSLATALRLLWYCPQSPPPLQAKPCPPPPPPAPQVAQIAINTTVGAVLGGAAAVVASYAHRRVFALGVVLNGILSGLVAVTAGAPYMAPPAAAVTGFVGFFVYYAGAAALVRLRVDDPVGAFPVHGLNGLWGLIAAGLFQRPDVSRSPHGYAAQLGWQVAGALVIAAWSGVTAGAMWSVACLLPSGRMRIVNADQVCVRRCRCRCQPRHSLRMLACFVCVSAVRDCPKGPPMAVWAT